MGKRGQGGLGVALEIMKSSSLVVTTLASLAPTTLPGFQQQTQANMISIYE
jgi:hypothetical protein